jgi:F-type H+-transporting ATPase subunit b
VIELNAALFVQLINFGILVVILNTFLYKPIRKALAERRLVIESARSRADFVSQEVHEKMALYEARLRDAKAEAGVHKAEALKQAQIEEATLLEKARSEAAATLESIRDDVARESKDARELLKKYAQGLSDDICVKILGRSL